MNKTGIKGVSGAAFLRRMSNGDQGKRKHRLRKIEIPAERCHVGRRGVDSDPNRAEPARVGCKEDVMGRARAILNPVAIHFQAGHIAAHQDSKRRSGHQSGMGVSRGNLLEFVAIRDDHILPWLLIHRRRRMHRSTEKGEDLLAIDRIRLERTYAAAGQDGINGVHKGEKNQRIRVCLYNTKAPSLYPIPEQRLPGSIHRRARRIWAL